MNVQSPHKWWSSLKSAVLGLEFVIAALIVGQGGELVCESIGIPDLLSDQFDSNHSR